MGPGTSAQRARPLRGSLLGPSNEEVGFRGMFAKNVTTYVPQFKLWILTNDVPRLSKWDQGIERRMRCVHFPTRFCYEPRADHEHLRDDTLVQRFRDEDGWCYGMLGLLLDALQPTSTLLMPPSVAEFTEEYLLANNPVGAWLKRYFQRTEDRGDRIQRTEMYQYFLGDTGLQKSQKAFSDEMEKCGALVIKTMNNRFYTGFVRKIQEIQEDQKEDV